MKEDLLYLYRVRHPEYGEIEVTAQDRLHAVCKAGKTWGTRWTAIARECACEKMGPAPTSEPAPEKKAAPRRRTQSKERRAAEQGSLERSEDEGRAERGPKTSPGRSESDPAARRAKRDKGGEQK